MGIKSPDSYYSEGKIKGKASRDKQIEGIKTPEKTTVTAGKTDLPSGRIDPSDRRKKVEMDHPSQKPSMNELPNFVKMSSATEIPGFLEGFKPSKKK